MTRVRLHAIVVLACLSIACAVPARAIRTLHPALSASDAVPDPHLPAAPLARVTREGLPPEPSRGRARNASTTEAQTDAPEKDAAQPAASPQVHSSPADTAAPADDAPASQLTEELRRVNASESAPGSRIHPAFLLLGAWVLILAVYFGIRRWASRLDKELEDAGIFPDHNNQ